MKQIKVSDLEGEQLAEFVAKAQELIQTHQYRWVDKHGNVITDGIPYRPDLNSAQAMELQKNFKINVLWNEALKEWICTIRNYSEVGTGVGKTPEIAICRAVVASVYGEYVEVSDD